MSFQAGQVKDETGDLEWALLSGQVATEAVLEALLEAYEAPLFRLANAFLLSLIHISEPTRPY